MGGAVPISFARLACAIAAASTALVVSACEEGGAHASGGPNSRAAYCEAGSNAALFLVDRTTQYDDTDQRVMIESIGSVIDGGGRSHCPEREPAAGADNQNADDSHYGDPQGRTSSITRKAILIGARLRIHPASAASRAPLCTALG
jgi:hypothetical protein